MNALVYTVLMSVVIFTENIKSDGNTTAISKSLANRSNVTALNVLIRRKRFLIFPDGSSFQIVFCTQNHGYLQLGNIVWFGTTAALAWELPTDPSTFDIFRDRYKVYEGKRRSDILYYLDEDGKVLDKIEYRRKIIINPAFSKRSINEAKDSRIKILKFDKKVMHSQEKNKLHLKGLDAAVLDLHRKEREKLYVKLEKFLQTLGWNGKKCILRLLCESGKRKSEQASFTGEIIRALFTLPSAPDSKSEVHKQYDDAHGTNEDCAVLYPNCGDISTE